MFALLTDSGKLESKFLPAVYFDSSVLIEYWLTESMNNPVDEPDLIMQRNEPPHFRVLRGVLRKENWFRRLDKVIKIREKLQYNKTKLTPVITPLSLMELTKWFAQSSFKQLLSEVAGVSFLKNKSEKDVADLLEETLEQCKQDSKNIVSNQQSGVDSLNWLVGTTWPNLTFGIAHALRGLYLADIKNFNLSVEESEREISAYSYLQLDSSDVFHILFAKHLGCEYIASFDSDFKRVKSSIKEDTGLFALTTPEEILNSL